MPGPKGRHRKDGNHDLVVAAVRQLGYFWWDASQSEMGVDGFAVGRGRVIPCEIKDPKGRLGLTLSPKESKIHLVLRANGVRVEILTGDDASLDVLRGNAGRNFYDPERNATADRAAPEAAGQNASKDPA